MSAAPHFLDLDSIDTDVTLIVKLKGVEHKMQPITLEDFIANMRSIQNLGTSGDVEKETSLLVEMLDRVFPTIGRDNLWKLNLVQLNAMLAKAQEFGGMNAVTNEAKDKLKSEGVENPLTPKS